MAFRVGEIELCGEIVEVLWLLSCPLLTNQKPDGCLEVSILFGVINHAVLGDSWSRARHGLNIQNPLKKSRPLFGGGKILATINGLKTQD